MLTRCAFTPLALNPVPLLASKLPSSFRTPPIPANSFAPVISKSMTSPVNAAILSVPVDPSLIVTPTCCVILNPPLTYT